MDDERAACEKRVGTTLCGKWTIDRLLGIGGMAAVYAATHKIGRREAIKILHPDVARSKDIRARFEREAHAVNRFRHPGVVEIRDIDATDDGTPFLVMELLEGESLADRLQRLGTLDPAEVLRLVDELLDVLDAAHGRQIIHRDIKLDNLFVEHGGRLKVLDFGIARMNEGVKTAMRTRTGATLGTVSYMAPEQVRGISVDHRADLFAVGATMFRLIAKRRLHEARTESELLVKMATMPAPALATMAPETPLGLCLVVDRALAFDRDQRYPDARTMQEDVRALRQGAAPPFASRLAAGGAPSAGAAGVGTNAAAPGGPAEARRYDPDARTAVPSAVGRPPAASQASWGGAAPVGSELSLGGSASQWDGPTIAAPASFDGGPGALQGAQAPASMHGPSVPYGAQGPASMHGPSVPYGAQGPASMHGPGMPQGDPAAAHGASWAPRPAPQRNAKLPLVLAIAGAAFTLGLALGVWRLLGSGGAEVPSIALPPDAGAAAAATPISPAEADPASGAADPDGSQRTAPSAKPTSAKGGSAPPITTITIDWPGLTRPKKK